MWIMNKGGCNEYIDWIVYRVQKENRGWKKDSNTTVPLQVCDLEGHWFALTLVISD